MNSNLPPEVHVESMRDDATYFFPVRPLGKLRWFGMLPLLFGVAFMSVPGSSLIGFAKHAATGKGGLVELFFACFEIPFVIVGAFPIAVGLFILCGRVRVEWKDKKLSAVEIAGPLRWRRWVSKGKDSIRKLSVNFGVKSNGKPVTSGPLADFATLLAEFDQSKPRVVIFGYPREWLEALASDLSECAGAVASSGDRPAVEVVDWREGKPEPDTIEKPVGSLVQMEEQVNGVTFVLPPVGVRKGSIGLLGFGIFWCVFMAVFTGIAGVGAAHSSKPAPWPVWLFVAGFWLIGIGLIAASIRLGRIRGTIRALGGTLQVEQDGMFGTRQWEWRREEIAALRAGDSGVSVNNRRLQELQIHPVTGKKVGLFVGRDPEELAWIAFELRKPLGVPARAEE